MRKTILTLATGIITLAGGSSLAEAATREDCGTPIKSIVRTEKSAWSTTSQTYKDIYGTTMNLVIPAGASQCVKVRFSAPATCSEEKCFVRAIATNTTLDPGQVPFTMNSGAAQTAGTYSFEWVKRLNPGTYQLRMQGAVQVSGDIFTMGVRTIHVEIAK
jgi:hypothetical protein